MNSLTQLVAAHTHTPDYTTASDSLEATCERYREELRVFFARRTLREEAVDDLVQLVYLRLLVYSPPRPIDDPRLFMYRVAWNVLRDENQRVRRERTITCDPRELGRLAETTGSLWVDDSTAELSQGQLEQVLRQLPRAWQFAFLGQYRDGHSYKEIAEQMGVSSHAVKKYIVKALHHFRSHFNETPQGRTHEIPPI